ncbi:MAG: hypothetical protein Kow0025_09660 [Thermodesulfovibrionales bacterium]
MGLSRAFMTAFIVLAGVAVAAAPAPGFEFPDIAASPSWYDFGVITAAVSSAALRVSVSNNGVADLRVKDISLVADRHYSLDYGKGGGFCGGASPVVPPGGSCAVTVTFSPRSEGEFTNFLVIKSDDPDTPELRVPLRGIGFLPRDGGGLTPGGPMERPGR